MIGALDRFWRTENANVHRGVYTLSEEATALTSMPGTPPPAASAPSRAR